MADISASTVHASAARTATGQTAGIAVPPRSERIAVLVNVTAVSGTTPSCTFSIEWSHDNVTFATVDTTPDAFAALTATGVRVKTFDAKGEYFRLVYTISGTTPSFTFASTVYGI